VLAESLAMFVFAWVVYPIRQGFSGDFLVALSHRDGPSSWDGEGIGYGPVFAVYDLLLRSLSDAAASWLAFALNHALLALSFIVLVRVFVPAPRTRRQWILAGFVWVNFFPLATAIKQNNVEITELFFIAVFLYALARGRSWVAGGALGLAIATKIVPVVLVPYLVWRRRWRVVLAALAVVAVSLTAVGGLKGMTPVAAAQAWVGSTEADPNPAHLSNQALSGLVHRAVDGDAPLGRRIAWALALLLIAIAGASFVRGDGWFPRPGSPVVERLEMTIVLVVSIVALPHALAHYYALVAFAFFVPLASGAPRRIFVGAYLLLGLLVPLRAFDALTAPLTCVEWAKSVSTLPLGALLLLVALLGVHRCVTTSEPSKSTAR